MNHNNSNSDSSNLEHLWTLIHLTTVGMRARERERERRGGVGGASEAASRVLEGQQEV